MQVLWSRGAPTKAVCRCRACFRRTTTAASKRQLNVGDLFTACYSTILGTAVFADAKVKEDRRKEWNRVITEARAEIPMDEPDRVERTVPNEGQLNLLSIDVRRLLVKRTKWDGTSMTNSLMIHMDPVDTTLNFHLKQATSDFTNNRRQTGPVEEDEEDWPDEADAPDKYSESDPFAAREPAKQIHLDKMEEMVSKLVTRLLLRRRQLSTLIDASSSEGDIALRLKEIADRIESLQGDTRLPSYTFTNDRATAMDRRRLNSAIVKLFSNTATDCSNIDLILAKICYNLLVSASPPNIQTYNILIWSFNRYRMYELSQVVVDSFLYESKFKPSSETIQLLLNHYSAQKDMAGFVAMVDRMGAENGDMRIRARWIGHIRRRHVQKWATTKKVVLKGGYLREKVSRDSAIFDSLIIGFLDLGLLRSAERYLRAALREGMQVTSFALLRLVYACTTRVDYKVGMRLLRVLLAYWEENSELIDYNNTQARLAVHQLLGLCNIDPSTGVELSLPHRISWKSVQGFKRYLAMQSVGHAVDRFVTRIMDVEAVLLKPPEGTHKPKNINQDIEKALSILVESSGYDEYRSAKRKANIDRTATMRAAETTVIKPKLVSQYMKLQAIWRERFDEIVNRNPDLCFSDRSEILSHFRRGKHIPPKHPLYPKCIKEWKPRKPGITTKRKTRQGYAASYRVTIDFPDEGTPETQLPPRPTEQHENSSPQTPESLFTPVILPTSTTMYLPLAPVHNTVRVGADGG